MTKKNKIKEEILNKLKYYKEQYEKNSKLESQFREELRIAQENKLKLIGAISALKKILEKING